jgi:hypothetical protein
VELELVEARYQRAVFEGAEEVLISDFELRYGARWRELYEASEGAGEEDAKRAEGAAEGLEALVKRRIDDFGLAAAYAKYARELAVEEELRLGLELLGVGPLERLLAWGLAMHFRDDVVAAPPYLARLLIELAERAPPASIDVAAELEALDRPLLALLEASLAEDVDWGSYELVHGPPPQRRIKLGKLAVYDPGVGLVVNPLTAPDAVLAELLSLKERLARAAYARLGLHGEYEFDERARCGTAYLSVDGTAEGSAEIYICPWFAPPRGLMRRGRTNKAFVVLGPEPAGFARQRYLFVFLTEEGARVVYPDKTKPIDEHIVDLLYRSGLGVEET